MKKSSHLLTLLIAILFCAACSNKAQQDTSAHAVLDRENNIIIKPIAEYEISSYSVKLYNRIIDRMYVECLARKGINYTPGESQVPIGSREYGLWNPDYIEQYGYGIFEPYSEEAHLPQEEQKEFEACYNTEEIKSFHQRSLEIDDKTKITEDIVTQARGYALKDDAWQEARKEWWGCLESKGLTPRTGDDDWGSKQLLEVDTSTQAGKEEKVRLALIEANCSQETGMAQTLANLEASYQAPLIRENQATLNQAKQAIQEFNADIDNLYQSSQ